MSVECGIAVAVIDDAVVTITGTALVASFVRFGYINDRTRTRSHDRIAVTCADVDSGVEFCRTVNRMCSVSEIRCDVPVISRPAESIAAGILYSLLLVVLLLESLNFVIK